MERKNEYERIKSFFKDYSFIRSDCTPFLMLSIFFELFHGVAMMVPYQEAVLDGAVYLVPMTTGIFGPAFYLIPSFLTVGKGKRMKIGELLKYLPVERKYLKRFRAERLAVFVCRVFPVFFCLQLLFSGLYYREIGIGNILYALCFGLIWPFLSNLCMILWNGEK